MESLLALTQMGSLVGSVTNVIDKLSSMGHSASTTKSSASSAESFQSQLQSAVGRYVQQRDANRNGTVEASEFNGNTETFNKVDLNRDGKLSSTELVQHLSQTSA